MLSPLDSVLWSEISIHYSCLNGLVQHHHSENNKAIWKPGSPCDAIPESRLLYLLEAMVRKDTQTLEENNDGGHLEIQPRLIPFMKIKLHPVWTLDFKTYVRFKQTYINKYVCVCVRDHLSSLSEFRFFSTVSSVVVTMLYIRSSDYSTDFLQMHSVRVSGRNRWNTQIAELGERLIKRAYL